MTAPVPTVAAPCLLVLLACAAAPERPPEGAAMMRHDDRRAAAFTDGPALAPVARLRAWLDGAGRGALLRVPVVVAVSPLGVAEGHVGVRPGEPGPNDLRVHLDDTALGIALADRARSACGSSGWCALWVEGTWLGEQVPGVLATELPVLRVLRVAGPVVSGDPERVLVAAPGP